jgi:hypothetical protein
MFTVEHQEDYKGMKIVCIFAKDSHRCGYVGIDKTHPLYGMDYCAEIPESLTEKWGQVKEGEVGKRSPIDLLCCAIDHPSVGILFNVHGGITFSGGNGKYPIESDLHFFGFDCAHLGDKTKYSIACDDVERSLDYVINECRLLADQLETIRR